MRLLPSPVALGPWERLSELSRIVGKGSSCFASLGVEPDKEFVGKSDADNHFALSFCDEPLTKGGEALIVFPGDIGDEKEDDADA